MTTKTKLFIKMMGLIVALLVVAVVGMWLTGALAGTDTPGETAGETAAEPNAGGVGVYYWVGCPFETPTSLDYLPSLEAELPEGEWQAIVDLHDDHTRTSLHCHAQSLRNYGYNLVEAEGRDRESDSEWHKSLPAGLRKAGREYVSYVESIEGRIAGRLHGHPAGEGLAKRARQEVDALVSSVLSSAPQVPDGQPWGRPFEALNSDIAYAVSKAAVRQVERMIIDSREKSRDK